MRIESSAALIQIHIVFVMVAYFAYTGLDTAMLVECHLAPDVTYCMMGRFSESLESFSSWLPKLISKEHERVKFADSEHRY